MSKLQHQRTRENLALKQALVLLQVHIAFTHCRAKPEAPHIIQRNGRTKAQLQTPW